MKFDLNKEFQKLATNEKFIEWVRNPKPASNQYWENFLKEHPYLQNELFRAKYVIKKLQEANKKIDQEQFRELWDGIQKEIDKPVKKVDFLYKWIAAASIVLLLGIGGIIWYLTLNNTDINYQSIAKLEPAGNKIQLILSDNSKQVIDAKEPSISYNSKGEILIDSTTLEQVQGAIEKTTVSEEMYNQLVVPYGKRSTLILSDGSTIFLNSGSRIIYPVTFSKEKREIYIEGEAYLKVAHNTQWPFFVVMDHLKVKVLGTEFNVKSYPEENKSSVVLVNGSVQALVKSKKLMMQENELLTLDNNSGKTSQIKTNIIEYVSWKDGWMFCNNEKMESIAAKLSRYYNVDVSFNEEAVGDLTISGKLDLKSNCNKVLDAICFSAPMKYEQNGDKILISKKN